MIPRLSQAQNKGGRPKAVQMLDLPIGFHALERLLDKQAVFLARIRSSPDRGQ